MHDFNTYAKMNTNRKKKTVFIILRFCVTLKFHKLNLTFILKSEFPRIFPPKY